LRAELVAKIRESDIVLVSDYDKGVCTPGLLRVAVDAAQGRGIRVIADPTRGVSGSYVMNKQGTALIGDLRAVRLIEAAYASL
jgi:bifunctional ADP-heptose synthase (sugar kinase/adenylyltransferase)